jgi:anti-sigma factor RsiW
MMCKSVREMISPYIDEALEPSERDDFIRHIQECSECRAHYEEIRDVHALLAGAERYRAPAGFSSRVMASVKAEQEAGMRAFTAFKMPFFLKFAEAAFAVVIAIVGIISGNILMMNSHTSERPPVIEESLSLDVFDPLPPDSIGGAYIVMTEVQR